jgi:hypothetical protein
LLPVVSFDLALLTARERLSCETRNKGPDDAEPNRDTWFLARGTRSDLGTIVIHGFVLHTIVMTLRRDLKRGVLGARIWVNMTFDVGATLLALAGHLGEIGLWAFALDLSGAVADIRAAIYSSAGSYTTSGSDIVLPPQWKLLGPFEAVDGMLMFGVSTAIIFAVIQRLIHTLYDDL